MSELLDMPKPIWFCKIGVLGEAIVPHGADMPMREIVQSEFLQITGVDADFCFSGWSAELTESELAVVKNRLPSEAHYADWLLRNAAPALLDALEGMIDAFAVAEDDPVAQYELRAIKQARVAIAAAKGGE